MEACKISGDPTIAEAYARVTVSSTPGHPPVASPYPAAASAAPSSRAVLRTYSGSTLPPATSTHFSGRFIRRGRVGRRSGNLNSSPCPVLCASQMTDLTSRPIEISPVTTSPFASGRA
jgi:hypothetical protein